MELAKVFTSSFVGFCPCSFHVYIILLHPTTTLKYLQTKDGDRHVFKLSIKLDFQCRCLHSLFEPDFIPGMVIFSFFE